METTRENLIQHVREWIKLDNELRLLQKEVKTRKSQMKTISNTLIEIMKSNEIDCFDMNDGKLMYKKQNVKKPISQKKLVSIIQDFFQDDVETAEELRETILNSREEVTKETIRRKVFSPSTSP
jgi:RNA polymerase-interacting CarD/CdnL/TRCF family regulator